VGEIIMQPVISVRNLTMTYRAPVRESTLAAAIGSLFHRQFREIPAVQGISFDVQPGEITGFIGPNGAGKTTTLKMLSGILRPTSGSCRILGYIPWHRDPRYLRHIAMIRGSQPIGGPAELTVMDALRLQQLIYDVPTPDFHTNLAQLSGMLGIDHLLNRQIRALSLGERMRCGLALALIYHPQVLFLDEPTIGMDISVVQDVRRFILDYRNRTGATILLTSHYMADVEHLCERIILIDRGTLAYDGALAKLSQQIAPFKLIRITAAGTSPPDWYRYGDIVQAAGQSASLRVHRNDVPAVTGTLLQELDIVDLSVEDPPLESVIDQMYRKGAA
jgi:ABC-2 type transport system ATP-binding protein